MTGFTLADDGAVIDTSAMSARFDIAADATFTTIIFTVGTTAPNANGSSLTLDGAGNGLLSISQNDANIIPLNGTHSVINPYRLILIQGGVPTTFVVGSLSAEPL